MGLNTLVPKEKKNGSQRSKGPRDPARRNGSGCNGCHKDGDCGLFVEEVFQELLTLERKRSERTRKPFMLMLLGIGALPGELAGNGVLTRITDSLFLATRETDLKGWYIHDSVIGVIFTEMGESERIAVRDAITAKLVGNLGQVLGPDELMHLSIAFHFFPEDFGRAEKGSEPDACLYPDLTQRSLSQTLSAAVKRALDVVGALAAILLLLPVFIGVALAVKLTSKGPMIFRQQRVGQFGRPFTFLKFRSMRVNNDPSIHKKYIEQFISCQAAHSTDESEECQEKVYKIQADPRITPVGRLIRKTSLDELPQFFNVLRGEMSLVGPRPPIPYEVECYDLWHKRRVLEVKPGITGLWQVRGRSSTTFDEMVRLDLQYVREQSFWLDLKILFQTPAAVLGARGAY